MISYFVSLTLTKIVMVMMKQWGHRWEGASDINKVQHKQDGVKDSAKVEGMVRQETSGRLGGDL